MSDRNEKKRPQKKDLPRIRYDQLTQFIPKAVLSLPQRLKESEQAVKERETERLGREAYFELRSDWSKYLFCFLFLMIVFQILLTAAIGFKVVIFADYQNFLYLVVGENFLQIVGMGFVAVRYLFSDIPDDVKTKTAGVWSA